MDEDTKKALEELASARKALKMVNAYLSGAYIANVAKRGEPTTPLRAHRQGELRAIQAQTQFLDRQIRLLRKSIEDLGVNGYANE